MQTPECQLFHSWRCPLPAQELPLQQKRKLLLVRALQPELEPLPVPEPLLRELQPELDLPQEPLEPDLRHPNELTKKEGQLASYQVQ